MLLYINGMPVKPTDFVAGPKDKPYYNIEVRCQITDLVMRFNHTQFYNENPIWIDVLRTRYE